MLVPSRRLFQAVKASAAAVDRVRPRRRGVTVLIYHRIGGGSGLQIDLPAATFEQQVAELAGRVVDLDTALDRLAGPAPADEPDPVVLTFDDGTADFVDVALPILERHRVPAVLYVATDFVERQQPFPVDGRPASWAALRDAASTGLVTFGSHTHTHALLDRLDPVRVDDELDRSVALLQERLGVAVDHFAYPKAVAGSAEADRAVRQLFRSAALSGTKTNRYLSTDPHRLSRSPIQVADGMRWFRQKVEGGMTFEDDLRRFVNRRRYADATT